MMYLIFLLAGILTCLDSTVAIPSYPFASPSGYNNYRLAPQNQDTIEYTYETTTEIDFDAGQMLGEELQRIVRQINGILNSPLIKEFTQQKQNYVPPKTADLLTSQGMGPLEVTTTVKNELYTDTMFTYGMQPRYNYKMQPEYNYRIQPLQNPYPQPAARNRWDDWLKLHKDPRLQDPRGGIFETYADVNEVFDFKPVEPEFVQYPPSVNGRKNPANANLQQLYPDYGPQRMEYLYNWLFLQLFPEPPSRFENKFANNDATQAFFYSNILPLLTLWNTTGQPDYNYRVPSSANSYQVPASSKQWSDWLRSSKDLLQDPRGGNLEMYTDANDAFDLKPVQQELVQYTPSVGGGENPARATGRTPQQVYQDHGLQRAEYPYNGQNLQQLPRSPSGLEDNVETQVIFDSSMESYFIVLDSENEGGMSPDPHSGRNFGETTEKQPSLESTETVVTDFVNEIYDSGSTNGMNPSLSAQESAEPFSFVDVMSLIVVDTPMDTYSEVSQSVVFDEAGAQENCLDKDGNACAPGETSVESREVQNELTFPNSYASDDSENFYYFLIGVNDDANKITPQKSENTKMPGDPEGKVGANLKRAKRVKRVDNGRVPTRLLVELLENLQGKKKSEISDRKDINKGQRKVALHLKGDIEISLGDSQGTFPSRPQQLETRLPNRTQPEDSEANEKISVSADSKGKGNDTQTTE